MLNVPSGLAPLHKASTAKCDSGSGSMSATLSPLSLVCCDGVQVELNLRAVRRSEVLQHISQLSKQASVDCPFQSLALTCWAERTVPDEAAFCLDIAKVRSSKANATNTSCWDCKRCVMFATM